MDDKWKPLVAQWLGLAIGAVVALVFLEVFYHG